MKVRLLSQINNTDIKFDFTFQTKFNSEVTGPIIIAIDPSKSGMGITIGRPSGEIVYFLEFSGTGLDTTQYCLEFKYFLAQFIKDAELIALCYEQMVVVKSNNKNFSYVAIDVLNEIQSYIKLFYTELKHNKNELYPINNQVWKHAILPKEYRIKNLKEKGSKLYLETISDYFKNVSNNITDSYCIFMYYITTLMTHQDIYPIREETNLRAIAYICTEDTIPENAKQFKYNPKISVEGNMGYVANRCLDACYADITQLLAVKDVYRLPTNFGKSNKNFYIVINNLVKECGV